MRRREWTPAEAQALRHFVTNLDGRVFAILGVPEEVVAVLFAYVSRSDAGFRENLLKLLFGPDREVSDLLTQALHQEGGLSLAEAQRKAAKFHETWVLRYGHGSVAEHAVVHLGIEGVSRLLSAQIELVAIYGGITEYSQRYQKPRRGDWVVPPELRDPALAPLARRYEELQHRLYDLYEELCRGLEAHWLEGLEPREGESERAFRSRAEKLAFEDARYALSLGMETSGGFTLNARNLAEVIVTLASSGYAEGEEVAEELRREGGTVLPTLLRYTDPNPYVIGARERLTRAAASLLEAVRGDREDGGDRDGRNRERGAPGRRRVTNGPSVELLDWLETEEALRRIARDVLWAYADGDLDEVEAAVRRLGRADRLALYQAALAGRGPHDAPIPALHQLSYQFAFCLSEANWHQFLRHRKVKWIAQEPSIGNGYTLPPAIAEAGLEGLLAEAVERAEEVYAAILPASPAAARYCVLNAHNRQVIGRLSRWELDHLRRLRGKPDAQWDIRAAVGMAVELVDEVHPFGF